MSLIGTTKEATLSAEVSAAPTDSNDGVPVSQTLDAHFDAFDNVTAISKDLPVGTSVLIKRIVHVTGGDDRVCPGNVMKIAYSLAVGEPNAYYSTIDAVCDSGVLIRRGLGSDGSTLETNDMIKVGIPYRISLQLDSSLFANDGLAGPRRQAKTETLSALHVTVDYKAVTPGVSLIFDSDRGAELSGPPVEDCTKYVSSAYGNPKADNTLKEWTEGGRLKLRFGDIKIRQVVDQEHENQVWLLYIQNMLTWSGKATYDGTNEIEQAAFVSPPPWVDAQYHDTFYAPQTSPDAATSRPDMMVDSPSASAALLLAPHLRVKHVDYIKVFKTYLGCHMKSDERVYPTSDLRHYFRTRAILNWYVRYSGDVKWKLGAPTFVPDGESGYHVMPEEPASAKPLVLKGGTKNYTNYCTSSVPCQWLLAPPLKPPW